jgi:hypothetical protein
MKTPWIAFLAFVLSALASPAQGSGPAGLDAVPQSLHETVLSAIERSGTPALGTDAKDVVLSWAAAPQDRAATGSAEALRVRWPMGGGRKTLRLTFRQPISTAGIAKTLSFWLEGPGQGRLSGAVIVRDIHGIEYDLPAFDDAGSGFRRVTLPVPPFVAQSDAYLPSQGGITVLGFAFTAEGRADVLFGLDMLGATVDTFYLDSADEDAMKDWW